MLEPRSVLLIHVEARVGNGCPSTVGIRVAVVEQIAFRWFDVSSGRHGWLLERSRSWNRIEVFSGKGNCVSYSLAGRVIVELRRHTAWDIFHQTFFFCRSPVCRLFGGASPDYGATFRRGLVKVESLRQLRRCPATPSIVSFRCWCGWAWSLDPPLAGPRTSCATATDQPQNARLVVIAPPPQFLNCFINPSDRSPTQRQPAVFKTL